MTEEDGDISTSERVRRARLLMFVILALITLGLVPAVFVQDRVVYIGGWLTVFMVYLTASLTTIATLGGCLSRRRARLIRYVLSVLIVTTFGAVLWKLGS